MVESSDNLNNKGAKPRFTLPEITPENLVWPKSDKSSCGELTDKIKQQFIDAVCISGRQAYALRAVGLLKSKFEHHVRADPEWKAAIEAAKECRLDVLRQFADKCAIHGFEEDVFHEGVKVQTRKRKASPPFLMKYLQAHLPEWKETKDINLNQTGDPSVVVIREPHISETEQVSSDSLPEDWSDSDANEQEGGE